MSVVLRGYDPASDFERVGRFLVESYRRAGGHRNWLQPRWEYMHFHPLLRNISLESIGVWEADDRIVAVIHPEHRSGTVYLEVSPDFEYLKAEMLEFAEKSLCLRQSGRMQLGVFINDDDGELQQIATARGYLKGSQTEAMSTLPAESIPTSSPLPEGFVLNTLVEDNDLRKLHRLLWRGFGHGEEPAGDGIEERRLMQAAPNYRTDRNIVVQAPSGQYVSYCGMWYEPAQRVAYVEPVATDPDYRRLGLGRAVVLEGARRCREAGATVTYVGSTRPFYQSMGFEEVYNTTLWTRSL